MLNKTREYSILFTKTILIAFLIISIVIPALLGNFKTNSTINYDPYVNGLSTNEFTKDNYSSILTDEEYGLGSVSIDEMHFNLYIPGSINNTDAYPLLDNDILSSALRFTSIPFVEFIETIRPAITDNLNNTEEIEIMVKLNETLNVEYNYSDEGYLIYHSHFSRAKLLEFYVDNGSSIIKLNEGIDYTLDDFNYIVFYYEDYFQKGPTFNFTMYLIWEYGIALGDWTLDQREETPLVMREIEQDFTSRLTYQFFLVGFAVTADLSGTIPIDYIDVALTINPPDKELLTYQDFIINNVDKNVNNYVNPDKSLSITLSDLFTPNRSFISLNFTANFGLKFEEPVGNSWAIDRLVDGRNIREKIYFISMVTGPPHIYLKDVAFYDTSIYIDEVISTNSLFNREVQFFDANTSIPRQLGLKVNIPYLIVGETCPFSIKYLASQTLNIVVTDTIKMPLVGVNIEILHFGATYGTYVSKDNAQPINPGRTDENGQVVLNDVPRGNYTVRVLWQGNVVKEAIVTTDKETNFVFTNVLHFPLWILIYGLINGIILIIGALIYLKYKKLR
jgi:hypothetical protein